MRAWLNVRTWLKGWLLPIGVALVLVFSVGALAIAAVTSSNTNVLVHQHNADLAQIKRLEQRLAADENQVVPFARYIAHFDAWFGDRVAQICTSIQISCPPAPTPP